MDRRAVHKLRELVHRMVEMDRVDEQQAVIVQVEIIWDAEATMVGETADPLQALEAVAAAATTGTRTARTTTAQTAGEEAEAVVRAGGAMMRTRDVGPSSDR